jgi:thioredoxin reductase (NADPH)
MTSKVYEILIIGAGPGGISMAAEARAEGICKDDILVFDKASEHSYVIRSMYPKTKKVTANFKGIKAICHGAMCLPDTDKRGTISYMDKVIEKAGITIHYNEEVQKVKALGTDKSSLFELIASSGTYFGKTVIVAIGVFGKPNKPSYKLPIKLKKSIHFDVNSFHAENENILVVGGGDSASEYAQYLAEFGNKLTLSYRKDSFIRMNQVNNESALLLEECGQMEILWSSNIKEVSVSKDNKPIVHFEEEKYGIEEYDRIVYALGGSTPENFLSTIGIDFIGKDLEVDENHEAKIKGLFVAGDLASGKKGGSIVAAFNSSRIVMSHICADYIDCPDKDDKIHFDYHSLHFIDNKGHMIDE